MEEGKEVVSMEEANGENGEGINKYACGCAVAASMISIIIGYGMYVFLPLSFFPMQLHRESCRPSGGRHAILSSCQTHFKLLHLFHSKCL